MPQVLIVDDEPAVLTVLAMTVRRFHCAPTIARSGGDALALIAMQAFDLVLSDLYLGDMTALDVFERGGKAYRRFVVMTGFATIETAVAATKAGVHSYLEKPITPGTLQTVLPGFAPANLPSSYISSNNGALGSDHVRRAIATIEHAYSSQELTLSSLACQLALSPDHLSRLFRTHAGCSVGSLIRRTRARHAQQLLAATNLSVKVIVGLCGYRSTTQLDRHFLRLFGHSPTDFRNNIRACAVSDFDNKKSELGD
jgi:YesN/AraC family two-component response regulator